jgi:hypothetical protein
MEVIDLAEKSALAGRRLFFQPADFPCGQRTDERIDADANDFEHD